MVAKTAVVGIDLGTSDSHVAFVGKGVVDVVQNEVSKRATPSLVGFTDRERLLGDAALAQIKSNAKNSCRSFKHIIGRRLEAPDLAKEAFWSPSRLIELESGEPGYEVRYKGETRQFSAVQCLAMYLTKLREVTEKWCQAKVADAVVSVPSCFSDAQRRAVLDAASIAGLTVSSLMNEHAATALAYGIYRSNDFDESRPVAVAFCSMGHALFSVSVVQFVRGRLTVLCERSDRVGGRDMDECLMREFAGQFRSKVGADPLSNKKASIKLEDAVVKTKKILSANSEAAISVECLMEDEDFASNVTRADFERMCAPAMARAKAVLDAAVAASPVPVEKLDSVEIVGGASRVPWVKRMCSEAFGARDLSTTMNQEESVARGCALQAAILSPLFKVRDFAVQDVSAFGVDLRCSGPGGDAEGEETVTAFPPGSALSDSNVLHFQKAGPFEFRAAYAEHAPVLPLTPPELGAFRVELPPSQAAAGPQRVKVKVSLSPSGLFQVDGAQLAEEEEAAPPAAEEVKKKEKKRKGKKGRKKEEGKEEAAAEEEEEAEEAAPEGAAAPEEAEAGAPRKLDLAVSAVAGTRPGLSPASLRQRQAEELAMQAEMQEVLETDEKRNDLESYIFGMRSKVAEGSEYGALVTAAERDAICNALVAAENWLHETPDGTKDQYLKKLKELRALGEPVAERYREESLRKEKVEQKKDKKEKKDKKDKKDKKAQAEAPAAGEQPKAAAAEATKGSSGGSSCAVQ